LGEIVKRHDKALGASGTDVVGKIHNTEDHIEILTGFQAAAVYDKMRRSDTQVRKILSAIANPIKSAKWFIEPYDDEKKSLEIANLIQHILFHDINWSKFLNEALTVIAHGHAIFEVVHMNRTDKEFGPYTGLGQLGFRRQSTIIEWIHDETTGELLRIKQESNTDIRVNVEIPKEFLLCLFSEQEGDNIGFPLLRNVYGPYKRKLLAMELQFIGIERFAIPTPMLMIPKNIKPEEEEYKTAVEVLKNFTSAEDSYLMYPEGWKLELHSNTFDPEKLTHVIKAEDENMVSAILASFLELGTGGNTGAYALSADLSDFFFAGLSYYSNIIQDTINKDLIPQLVSLNFGPDEVAIPKIMTSGITDNAGKELMEVITGFTGAGVISRDEQLEDHVRRLYSLPKKAEGTMLENEGETDASSNNGGNNNNIDPDNDSQSDPTQLSEKLGHRHKGTGPSIQRGQSHYHEILNDEGEVIGRTEVDKDTPAHTHGDQSKKIEIKELKEPSNNTKVLIEKHEAVIVDIIRRNLTNIAEKYTVDLLKNYKTLSDKQKMRAIDNVKIGGTAQFRKELRGALTSAARDSLELVESEVGVQNVKFSEDEPQILKEFEIESFKFNDFSKLPKRVQLIIATQANLISEKEARDVADTVAFQFGSSVPSTNDIAVLREDLKAAAEESINSGTKKTVAADLSATVIGNARNEYLLADDVQEQIASYTFVNSDPKTDICKTLAGTTYDVTSADIVRYQPPLHHNAVLEDSLIMTGSGAVKIKDLKVGDMVLTHKNRLMPITEVMDRFEDKEYYLIELDNGVKINITGEHPVLTKSRGWVQVFDLTLNDDIVCLEDFKND